MALKGAEIMKPKKFFITAAVTEDELLLGLKTMKEWGVVSKNFQEKDTKGFYKAHNVMEQVKCKIATL